MKCPCEEFALIFKALSDETRLAICSLAAKKEICGCELLEKVKISQPTLSYHMKMLTESGIITGRKDGIWTRYTLNHNKIQQIQEFFKNIRKCEND